MEQGLLEKLGQTMLFGGLSTQELCMVLEKVGYQRQRYEKGELIFIEEDPCESLGIVLTGQVELYKGIHSGKRIPLTKISSGDMFAEAVVFSALKRYPVTIEALENTEVLYLSGDRLMKMYLMLPSLIEVFIRLLSQKILILNDRINLLSLKNMRQKIAYILVKEGKENSKGQLIFQMSKQKLAEKVGVERPSLSRELTRMEEEGLLEKDGKKILVTKKEAFMELLQF